MAGHSNSGRPQLPKSIIIWLCFFFARAKYLLKFRQQVLGILIQLPVIDIDDIEIVIPGMCLNFMMPVLRPALLEPPF